MRHWHRCIRWHEKGIACPFDKEEGKREERPQDARLRFEKKGRTKVGRGPPVSGAGKPVVSVREPRYVTPWLSEKSGGRPWPKSTKDAFDVVGMPFPEAAEAEVLAPVVRTMAEAIGQVPEAWAPSREQVARLVSALGEGREATRESVVGGVAELATADAFGRWNPGEWAPLAAIPVLERLFRKTRGRAGLVGKPGPADPARPASTFRTGKGPDTTRTSYAPRKPGIVPARRFRAPVRVPRSGAMHVNMAAWMKGLTGAPGSRRTKKKIGGEGG